MGETPEAVHVVQYSPDAISTIELQVISLMGNKVREVLSTKQSVSVKPNQSKDKRWLHPNTAESNGSGITAVPIDASSSTIKKSKQDLPQFTLQEVSYHDNVFDCWVVIYDRVYDVTSFLQKHPGGEEIMLEYAGRDATLAFRSVGHSKMADEALLQYRIGILVEEEQIWTRFYKLVSDTPTHY